jgi:hypothetical protein
LATTASSDCRRKSNPESIGAPQLLSRGDKMRENSGSNNSEGLLIRLILPVLAID